MNERLHRVLDTYLKEHYCLEPIADTDWVEGCEFDETTWKLIIGGTQPGIIISSTDLLNFMLNLNIHFDGTRLIYDDNE